MVDIYLPCLFVAQLNYPLIFTNTLVKNWFDIYHTETQKMVHFCQYNKKVVGNWFCLFACLAVNSMCGIFWQVIFVNIRFFVNCCAQKIKKAKSNLPVLLFHVIALLFIRETAFNISCQFSETYQIFLSSRLFLFVCF